MVREKWKRQEEGEGNGKNHLTLGAPEVLGQTSATHQRHPEAAPQA